MMRSISLDESQLATLTPEEQAAIRDGDEGLDPAALRSIAGDDDNDNDDVGDDSGNGETLDANGKPVADPAPAPAAVDPAPAPAPASTPADPVDPAPARTTSNEYRAELPPDFSEKLTALAEQETSVRAQFKDGDIDLETYEAQRDSILQQRETLRSAQLKAEISQEMREQNAQNEWKRQIESFIDGAAMKSGINYRTDTAKAEDFDLYIKTLANKPENQDKSSEWFLNEAHKRVMALHGVAATDAPAPTKRGREPNLTAVPRSLAQVPGGDGPGDIATEFAHLDALDGNDLEAAIAKMSPSQREKYSQGG